MALAHIAGAPAPRLPPRKELIGEWAFAFLCLLVMIALPLWLLKWLTISVAGAIAAFSMVGFVCLYLCTALLAGFVGMMLGGLLALLLLRPFFSHGEIAALIRHGILFWPDPGSELEEDWWRKFFRRFAERLYGRPI